MRTYFLDTSVIIDYLRGKKEIVSLVNNLDGALVSSYICLSELFEGVYQTKNIKHNHKIITDFFSGLNKVYGLDLQTAIHFGKLRNDLRLKGKLIEDLDILIASTCLTNNLTLLTLNKKHFSRIQELNIKEKD